METLDTQNPTPDTSGVTENPQPQGEPGGAATPENMIPYARFKAVIDDRNDIKARLDALENEATTRAADEAKEQGRWKDLYENALAEIETLKGQIEAERLTNLRRTIGAKYGLSERLIDRLRGTTEAEIDSDAAELADAMPTPKAPNIDSERIPANQVRTVTPEQFRKMSYQEQQALFQDDPELFKRLIRS